MSNYKILRMGFLLDSHPRKLTINYSTIEYHLSHGNLKAVRYGYKDQSIEGWPQDFIEPYTK